MDTRPIGVFDSGMGGLTAVKKLRELLPGEDIVYFGDTGRVPYGGRSEKTLIKYVSQDIAFLESFQVKMLVAACGTASAVALPKLQKAAKLPMLGVLDAAANAALTATKNGKIAVIATAATVKSDAYRKRLLSLKPELEVFSKACPLFVPLVENGHTNSEVAHLVAEEYLQEVRSFGADTLIMGCTHYPLLSKTIGDVLGGGVKLIDVGEALALEMKALLEKDGLLSGKASGGTCRYYVSDEVDNFETLGGLFLQSKIEGMVSKIDIDKYECACADAL